MATARGLQRIDQIREGDLVLARQSDGSVAPREVVEVQVHHGEFSLLRLETQSDRIGVTTRHRFGTTSGGWISSEDILPGTKLRRASREQVVKTITMPERWAGTVYNLKVSGGNYFVSNDHVLVRDY